MYLIHELYCVARFLPIWVQFWKKKLTIFFLNFHLFFIAASNFLKMSYDNAKACAVVETTDTETRSNLIEPPTHHIQTEVTIPKYPEDSHFGGAYMYLKFNLASIGVLLGGSLMFLLPRERPRRKTHWKWHWLPIEVPQTQKQGRRKHLGGTSLEQKLGRYYLYVGAIFMALLK